MIGKGQHEREEYSEGFEAGKKVGFKAGEQQGIEKGRKEVVEELRKYDKQSPLKWVLEHMEVHSPFRQAFLKGIVKEE